HHRRRPNRARANDRRPHRTRPEGRRPCDDRPHAIGREVLDPSDREPDRVTDRRVGHRGVAAYFDIKPSTPRGDLLMTRLLSTLVPAALLAVVAYSGH